MNNVEWRAPLTVGALVVLGLGGSSPVRAAAQQDERCECPSGMVLNWDGDGVLQSWPMGRARIGIGMSAEDPDDRGVIVSSVQEDSPAERAGLEEGDVIVSVDGHDLMEPLDAREERRFDEDQSLPVQRLMALAADWEGGDEVLIGFARDGQLRTVTVEPEELGFDMEPFRLRMGEFNDRMRTMGPEIERQLRVLPERVRAAPRVRLWDGEGPRLAYGFGSSGMELRELTPELGRYFGSDAGVLVLDIPGDSEMELMAGDVILSIDGREVDTPSDVRRILRSYRAGESLSFELMRDGARTTIESEAY